MNNSRAVEILSKIEALPCGYCYQGGEEFEEAVDLAIKALETMEMIKKHYILIEKSVRDNPNDLMIGRAPTVEPQNEWGKWGISEVRCPNCLEYFNTDCYSKGELNKCPSCGAKMKGGAE